MTTPDKLTPAAERLKEAHQARYLRMRDHGEAPVSEVEFYNELAAAVLNTDQMEVYGPTSALKEVLKAEFPLISAPEELWEKASIGMLAKLESLGFQVVECPPAPQPTQEEE